MGGHVAFHAAFRRFLDIDSCFVLSSFLCHSSAVYETVTPKSVKVPKLLYLHGEDDDIVPVEWARVTHKRLDNLGINSSFVTFPGLKHDISKDQLELVSSWL